jgi:hypothetical protein
LYKEENTLRDFSKRLENMNSELNIIRRVDVREQRLTRLFFMLIKGE